MIPEGGRCGNCGAPIGSYQRQPGQTSRGGVNYCSSRCRQEAR